MMWIASASSRCRCVNRPADNNGAAADVTAGDVAFEVWGAVTQYSVGCRTVSQDGFVGIVD